MFLKKTAHKINQEYKNFKTDFIKQIFLTKKKKSTNEIGSK